MRPFLIITNDKMPSPGQAPRSSPNKTPGAAPNLYDHFAEHLQREPRRGPTLADDWRDFCSEVRGSPCSHALVAIGAVVGWTVLLVAPLMLGLGK